MASELGGFTIAGPELVREFQHLRQLNWPSQIGITTMVQVIYFTEDLRRTFNESIVVQTSATKSEGCSTGRRSAPCA